MHYYIRNMVCNRCIMVVKQIFEKAGASVVQVKLGEVELEQELGEKQLNIVKNDLEMVGFGLLDSQKHKIIEKIRTTIVARIQEEDMDGAGNFSRILSEELHRDYSYLSKLFSEMEGITIERYVIAQKTEKVKELLAYGELNLSEIAYRLGYSSVAHLSSQFKKTTGFTPTEFRKLKDHHRRSLDEL